MASHAMFAEIAALAGDPGRAGMLHALMDGRALTATELARVAGIAPQTASGHLGRMTAIGLVGVERQGRHRYHRLASPAVARMLESIMEVAADLEPSRKRFTIGPRDAALRNARTCYDHLAGRLGVAIADALVAQGHAELAGEAGIITESGVKFLAGVGVDVGALTPRRTKGGARAVPALSRLERAAAASRRRGRRGDLLGKPRARLGEPDGRDRAVAITPLGARMFREAFGAPID